MKNSFYLSLQTANAFAERSSKADVRRSDTGVMRTGLHRAVYMLSATAVCIAAMLAMPAHAIEQGVAAPSFEIEGQNGQVNLSAYHGKLVYLDFWASWCGPCKRSFPWMRDLQTRFGAQGLQVVAVNLDAKHADAVDFLKEIPANFVVGFDPSGAVAHTYGIKGMPSSVLIAPDGKVIKVHQGFNDADKAELENLVKNNLK